MTTLRFPVTSEDHIQGAEDAQATLLEYGDYECPDCGYAHPIVKRLQRHFGKKLRVVFRNFPLSEIHPNAETAAETAEFAGAHGQFWEMHDLLLQNQDRLGGPLYVALAQRLSLVPDALLQALEAQEFGEGVRADLKGGVRSGVHGTPTFFVNGLLHDGPYDFEHLAITIQETVSTVENAGKR